MSSKRNCEIKAIKVFLNVIKLDGVKMQQLLHALLSTVTFNLGFAKEDQKEDLSEIYHIYNGNEYIGAVSSQETIDKL